MYMYLDKFERDQISFVKAEKHLIAVRKKIVYSMKGMRQEIMDDLWICDLSGDPVTSLLPQCGRIDIL